MGIGIGTGIGIDIGVGIGIGVLRTDASVPVCARRRFELASASGVLRVRRLDHVHVCRFA